MERLSQGPPGQTALNFALALLPVEMTVLITLQTVTFSSEGLKNVYWTAFWVLLVQGLYYGVRWRPVRGSQAKLIEEIRQRMPDRVGLPEQAIEPFQGETAKGG